ncbi:MAG TPA: hypothetical protein VGQ94_03445 [Terriglobales bacterium]|nr:hypothetical protein [Terriglobales bacterium]
MNRRSRYFSFLIVLVALAVAAPADVKVKTKNIAAGHSAESTVYIKGARQRDENPQMPFATILQCDQKRMLQVNDKCKVYMVTPMAADDEAAAPSKGKSQPAVQPAKSTKGGVVTYTTTMTDTKERKTMLGFPARHIKSAMTAESSPDACTKTSMKSETDGWYADLSVGLTCSRASARPQNPMAMEKPECQDEYRMKRVGMARMGYPLQQTATVTTENGQFSSSTEALEISKDPLDAALFDVPADYKEVTNYQELMCMPSREPMTAQVPSAAPSKHKRAGVLLIGVVGFDNPSGHEISLENMRQRLMGHLTEINVDTVPLDKTTDAEIHDEATEKHCDYVLYTNLTSIAQSAQAKVGGFFGKATGAGSGRGGKFESKVDFRLYPVADHPDKASLVSNTSVKEDKDAEETTSDALQKESQAVMEQVGKDAAKRGGPK